MKEFEHLSGRISSRDIGLGWLDGLTLRTATEAESVEPHSHPHMEVILCLHGEFTYRIEGFPPVVLGADRGIVIPAHRLHALENNSELPGERVGLHLLDKMSKTREYAIFSPEDYRDFHNTLTKAAARPFRLSPALKAAARELADNLRVPPSERNSPARGLIRILCCSVLYDLIRILSAPLTVAPPQLMEEAVRYLEAHLAEPFRVSDLVRHMGYSRARLFTLFKRHTGLTPNDYLIRLRVKKARKLLSSRALSIGEIAAAVGFGSSEYFSSVFRRYAGQTPSAFRNG